jgi:NADH:ubiquinone oxidoreductase subunit 3 (subunit A)
MKTARPVLRYVLIAIALTLIVLGLVGLLTGCNTVGTMQANPNEYSNYDSYIARPL